MKTALFCLALAFACIQILPAQDTTWFDSKWNDCTRSKATYYHLESKKGNLVSFTDYFASNNQQQNTGFLLNGMKHGLYVWYYENGNKSIEAEYAKGERDGAYASWLEDGTPEEKRTYKNGEQVGATLLYDKSTGKWEEVAEISDIGHDWGEIPDNEPAGLPDKAPYSPGQNDYILLDEAPTPLNLDEVKALIGYPSPAKDAEIEGKVVVKVCVNESGVMEKYILEEDPHPILSEAVTAQLDQLRFTPAKYQGKAIKCWISLPFDFYLSGSTPPDATPLPPNRKKKK
jgi:protein TonB